MGQPENQPSGVAADRVAEIVAAAEETAAALRREAEARAAERIAEADRAADYRVQAAEEEAAEIVARAHVEADAYAQETREAARTRAAELVREAREVASSVMDEGAELSDHLQQLSQSLRTNAERLLRDVAAAHRQLTRRLDAVAPEGRGASPPRGRSRDAGDDLDVPEFLPRK